MNKTEIDYSLYLVTDRLLLAGRSLYECVEQALAGGASLLQLREKSASTREFYEVALRVKEIANRHQVPLLINDRLDIALAVDADGLHIGQDDLPVAVARKWLGPDKVIGVSASAVAEAKQAEQEGADYLGVGAVYPTGTKTDADKVSLAQLHQIKESVHIPVVAIGGITAANVQEVMRTGIDGVAVVSAIVCQGDFQAAARALRQRIAAVR